MKKSLMLCSAAVLLFNALLVGKAQKTSTPLTAVEGEVVRSVKEKKPEWSYKSVTPVYENEEVIIQQWTLGEHIVKVSIVPHDSHQGAATAMRKFAARVGPTEGVKNMGDEAYVYKMRRSVVFRKGKFMIYISALTTGTVDEFALGEEFAKLVADALRNH
jgi:hypothetical protein